MSYQVSIGLYAGLGVSDLSVGPFGDPGAWTLLYSATGVQSGSSYYIIILGLDSHGVVGGRQVIVLHSSIADPMPLSMHPDPTFQIMRILTMKKVRKKVFF